MKSEMMFGDRSLQSMLETHRYYLSMYVDVFEKMNLGDGSKHHVWIRRLIGKDAFNATIRETYRPYSFSLEHRRYRIWTNDDIVITKLLMTPTEIWQPMYSHGQNTNRIFFDRDEISFKRFDNANIIINIEIV